MKKQYRHRNITEVIDAVAEVIQVRQGLKRPAKLKDVAAALKMDAGVLATKKSRKSAVPYQELIDYCMQENINLVDLVTDNSPTEFELPEEGL